MKSLKDLFAQGVKRDETRGLSLNLVGLVCVRDVWFRAEGMTPNNENSILKHVFARALDGMAEDSDLDVLTHRTVKIEIGGVRVRGVVDAMFVDENGPSLVSMLHVVGDKEWGEIENNATDEHRKVANLGAYALEAPKYSVCYVHAGTGEIREHIYDMDGLGARKDFGAFEEVAYWMRLGIPPPRPYEDFEKDGGEIKLARDNEPCVSCPNRSLCWESALERK